MMTKQEIFDKVVAHLRAQGGKALNENQMCQYRARGGAKCAIGCLILDEHYSRRLEGKRAFSDLVVKALRKSGVPDEAGGLLRDLQRIHDHLYVRQWEDEFVTTAGLHGLTYAAP